MLEDKDWFESIESESGVQEVIKKFERENGKVLGRMMINIGELPENIEFDFDKSRDYQVFIGTFDFYDVAIGIAVFVDNPKIEVASGTWLTFQKEGADLPDEAWVKFFY